MNENNELVVDSTMAEEMGCNLDDITIGDAAAMNAATGMVFEIKNGHIVAIYD